MKANQRLHDYTVRLEVLQQYQQSVPGPGSLPDDAPKPGS